MVMVVKHSSSHWGPSAHSHLVDVEPYRGTVPPVTAIEPAKFLDPSA
jgi:hypothetical protein